MPRLRSTAPQVALRKLFCAEHDILLVDNNFCEECQDSLGIQDTSAHDVCSRCNTRALHNESTGWLICPKCKVRLMKP